MWQWRGASRRSAYRVRPIIASIRRRANLRRHRCRYLSDIATKIEQIHHVAYRSNRAPKHADWQHMNEPAKGG